MTEKTKSKAFSAAMLRAADFLLALLVAPAAIILKKFRQIGAQKLPVCSTILEKIGVWPIQRHFGEPLFRRSEINESLRRHRPLPGIDLRVASQLQLLSKFPYREELIALDWKRAESEHAFHINNRMFEGGDADMLYNFIRHFKPRRVIEIGSGHSTKVAQAALRKNRDEDKVEFEHYCFDPFGPAWLEGIGPKIVRKPAESCADEIVRLLHDGDLLFIDSSHIIRPQGDVVFEYLQLLPSLECGVLVHVHDVFTPRDYLDEWLLEEKRFWNEQYLLEALLSNTRRYEIVLANNYLSHDHPAEFNKACPYMTDGAEPGSLYFKVRSERE